MGKDATDLREHLDGRAEWREQLLHLQPLKGGADAASDASQQNQTSGESIFA